jgi:hypothetical protein
MRTGHRSAPILVCGLVVLRCAYCHGGTTVLCGGCDFAPDQWFRKCFPSPARTRKLEPYGYQDLCLSCGESVSTASYSNLRMPLPTLCCRDVFTASEDLAGLLEARKIIFIACVVRSCACCQYEDLSDGAGHLVAALHASLWLLCDTRPHSLFLTGTELWNSIAPVFIRQHPPLLQ